MADEDSRKFFREPALRATIRFFAEVTLSGIRFFATLRMTRSEGPRMTRSEEFKGRITGGEGLTITGESY